MLLNSKSMLIGVIAGYKSSVFTTYVGATLSFQYSSNTCYKHSSSSMMDMGIFRSKFWNYSMSLKAGGDIDMYYSSIKSGSVEITANKFAMDLSTIDAKTVTLDVNELSCKGSIIKADKICAPLDVVKDCDGFETSNLVELALCSSPAVEL